jgi:hypothetical protein
MSPLGRQAAERNEKSSHSPHVCRTGCGCNGRKKKPATSTAVLEKTGRQQRQVYKGARPWVIEH